MGISKSFDCLDCHVFFTVTVEKDKPEDIIRDQFPNSAEALEKLDECPFCGGEIVDSP